MGLIAFGAHAARRYLLGSFGILLSFIVAACEPQIVEVVVTRVVDRPIETVVTRVVEVPVETIVTRVVEEPIDEAVTKSPESAPTSRTNVALSGSAFAVRGKETSSRAIDDDLESFWTSGAHPAQSIQVKLDGFHLVDSIELVVAQSPAGETNHEVWVGDITGIMTKLHEFIDVPTSDGQALSVTVNPPLLLDRITVLTTKGPSWVAWREIRVFGIPAQQQPANGLSSIASQESGDWPQINLRGRFEMPVQITHAGDGSGRLFVVEQKGRIRIIDDGTLRPTPFLDLSNQVSCCGEQGLLGVAFPPDYAKKQYFYVNYTDTEGNTVVARYRLTFDPNVADPQSAETILEVEQPDEVHNGGHMAFGPNDGYLYIGIGDGGVLREVKEQAQNPDTLLGKLVRIDVESGVAPYEIPASNPFVGREGYRGEIWALGLRNPWGFAFDSKNGDLYIGDVGGSEFEEVNYQPASSKGGENYGWPTFEGIQCHGYEPQQAPDSCIPTGLTRPVVQYPHSQGCAIVGGTVYRGARYVPLQGIYFYADFCSGRIWGLRRVGDNWQSALLFDAPFLISGIGEDEEGNLYVANYTDGTILELGQRLQVSTATPTETAEATIAPAEETTEPVELLSRKGQILFVERGCVACHVVESIPEAVGTSGPALDGFGDPSKWPLIAGVLANTPDNVRRWILDPASFKSDTAMLNMGLSDADADAIAAFLQTLK